MNGWWRYALVVMALAGFAAAARAEEPRGTREQLEQLQREQRRMREEIERLKRELESPRSDRKRVEELERKQSIVTDELRRLREAFVLPETRELKSFYGLGPAASKVYGLERGLSIGGYGEANLRTIVGNKGTDTDVFDFLRLVLYVGYKFNDWIVFNSETEFEHASTGKNGEVSVEFANLDFLLHEMANARFGLVLVPVGFINEIHEPPFFFGNVRPPVETVILPSTWRANGFGFFGELLPGLTYRTYGITSLDASGFRSAGIRGGRQSGSLERAEDFSWVGRLDYSFMPNSFLGASAYVGDQGQGRPYGNDVLGRREVGAFMQLYEGHLQLRWHGLEFRALGAVTLLDNATRLSVDPTINETIGNRMLGYYAEIGYDVLPWIVPGTTQYLAPWFRYSHTDTQQNVPAGLTPNNRHNRDYFEAGLQYKPIPQVVLKLDYRNLDAETGTLPDEVRIGAGFVF
ncbi:MAG: hypothetical protein KatS3mg077_0979 [Candidatus Binatia bacterium]|nr:MAG: hypothetical protein KatS3mg077_0979 [Candidatus Binatia bacterium]